jgi:hypothetical protein
MNKLLHKQKDTNNAVILTAIGSRQGKKSGLEVWLAAGGTAKDGRRTTSILSYLYEEE